MVWRMLFPSNLAPLRRQRPPEPKSEHCKGHRCRRRAPQIPQERAAQWQRQRGRNPPVFLKCSYSLDHPPDYGRVPLGTDPPCDFRILSIVDVSPVKFRTMSPIREDSQKLGACLYSFHLLNSDLPSKPARNVRKDADNAAR